MTDQSHSYQLNAICFLAFSTFSFG